MGDFCMLDFGKFRIDFKLDLASSLEYSVNNRSIGERFVFAVVPTFLQIDGKSYVLDSAQMPGNFLLEAEFFAKRLEMPVAFEGLQGLIKCGGWWDWMQGYWDRIDLDTVTDQDEQIYDKLEPLSVWSSDCGDVVVYQYDGRNIVEAYTRASETQVSQHIWTEYDPIEIAARLNLIRKVIEEELIRYCHKI